MNGYSQVAPSANDIISEAYLLDNELKSIREQWPQAKIVVIGHSLGGLIAKQWWRNFPWHATTAWNVVRVFSLDSPINGAPDALHLLQLYDKYPIVQTTCRVSGSPSPCPSLAQQLIALWYDYAVGDKQDDISMAKMDVGERGIFIPIGTRGDIVMEIAAAEDCVGLRPNELALQLLTHFTSSCGDLDTFLEPGRITPGDYSFHDGWFETHKVVFRQPDNIAFLTQQVDVATGNNHSQQATQSASALSFQTTAQPNPSAHLTSPVVQAGSRLVLAGTDLGSVTGEIGILSSAHGGMLINCPITQWSDRLVTAQAPLGVTTGLVIGFTGAGTSFTAGSVTVLSRSEPVVSLHIQAPATAPIDGQPGQIVVTALDVHGHPVNNVPISLSDGLVISTIVTDTLGRVTFNQIEDGENQLIVFSGTTWTSVLVKWLIPPPSQLHVVVSPTQPQPGEKVTLTGVVTDASGHPISHQAVYLQALGSLTVKLTNESVVTNLTGRFTTTIVDSRASVVVIGVVTNYGFTSVSSVISWQRPTSSGLSIATVITSIAVGILLGGVLLVAVLRSRRRFREATRRAHHQSA